MINVKTLEIKCVNNNDIEICRLHDERMSMIDCRTDPFKHYYKVKDFITDRGYTHSVSDALDGYRHLVEIGGNDACSTEDIIRNCKESLKYLYEHGYN